MTHKFHIPVLGLAFSIDSPIKVARYGISSVISVVDDELIERMRFYYAKMNNLIHQEITRNESDYRAKRISAYLNLVQDLVNNQIETIKSQEFTPQSELTKYFELLPENSLKKLLYQQMINTIDSTKKSLLQTYLKDNVTAGDIDVNIMSKVDKINSDKEGHILDEMYSDASAALRGFANSKLHSSLILSAGMNPRLYNYIAEFPAFLPNENGILEKKITLKVSDFRSAHIQSKYLAKKGIWVSEFRIESGLNCGGHAFATDGYLLGPILEEFKQKKDSLLDELRSLYEQAIEQRGLPPKITSSLDTKFSVQGGVGNAEEQSFLIDYYGFDSIGWGSPFLLVPEATTVDEQTLSSLKDASDDDFYLSNSSPLGVLFNNFRPSSSEQLRLDRIRKGKPGSPCIKRYLVSSTEFSKTPICTASRAYQKAKIKELEKSNLQQQEFQDEYDKITEKNCLCEGLASAAYLKYNMTQPKENTAVAICPGPNTKFFKNIYSLKQMVDHIYGRIPLTMPDRPHMFLNELKLYIDYYRKYIELYADDSKSIKFKEKFKGQLLNGIQYYRSLLDVKLFKADLESRFLSLLESYEASLLTIS
ncbi:hypothetical protein [Sphingobacterium sp. LRF_L2]|uniref:hypothetical protein n=1 Tax=Sphingobacterium sp. LRF_L2 TaxID=3369421 RepID=UPI003F5F4E17